MAEAIEQSKIDAINHVNGPELIIAGPGTGKTYTLVKRIENLILNHHVDPNKILIATFTEKAAKELVTRLTNLFTDSSNMPNLNEMYIGTFHSICLRILKENIEYSRLKKNYRVLDGFDQNFTVFRNISKFRKITNFQLVVGENTSSATYQANKVTKYVNTLSEELVDIEQLKNNPSPKMKALGEIIETYRTITTQQNVLDFSSIQVETFNLLNNHPEVLKKIQNQIEYLMIDEYQDTNFIQEKLVFLLAGEKKNICVVGDDDQSLYRFRGATVRNILEFPDKFPDGCATYHLNTNFRSTRQIVDFYNHWMSSTEGKNFAFKWDHYRFPKNITAAVHQNDEAISVVKLANKSNNENWFKKIIETINKLKDSGKISDYNQVAFLFKSVKNNNAIALANYLEKNGVKVYSPRSALFFERDEIIFAIGCLLSMFPNYVCNLEQKKYTFLKEEYINFCLKCVSTTASILSLDITKKEMAQWIIAKGITHSNLEKNTDYNFTGLIYQLFQFEAFKRILDTDTKNGAYQLRTVRNLGLLTQILGKYEFLNNISILTVANIEKNVEDLFNIYLRLLFEGGISEYEDDSEYAPSGCVSFLTIHQSKGMEFPVVFVDSLGSYPTKQYTDFDIEIEEQFFEKGVFEPYEYIKFFDFWRLYYTAFSRAQDLLILTCNIEGKTPSNYFENVFYSLPDIDSPNYDYSKLCLHTVKPVNIKPAFAFTSHITVYETCSLQYKFFKELEFQPIRAGAMVFGRLVHETIEDIHKAALRGEVHNINEENITGWFNTNYESITLAEHSYLSESQKAVALKQVINYANRQKDWSIIKEAEVDVSLVRPDYIIEGKVDLITGKDNTVEIVDFKSESKPDINITNERLEHYKRQLNIYAYLVEQRTGHKVSKMHLYYTGEDSSNPKISFNYTTTAVEGTIAAFDDTVRRIMKKDFNHCASDTKTCKNCDFRFYCEK